MLPEIKSFNEFVHRTSSAWQITRINDSGTKSNCALSLSIKNLAHSSLLPWLTFAFASLNTLKVQERISKNVNIFAGENWAKRILQVVTHGDTAEHSN